MGCCQSGSTPEDEVPARGRNAPKDREPSEHKRDDLSVPPAVAINDAPGDDESNLGPNESVAEHKPVPDKQLTVDDALDKIVATGWKYFIMDSSSNYMSLPADEDMEEDDTDWSITFNPRLIPPLGLPQPSARLFSGAPRASDPAAALSTLRSCAPAPCRTHRMIEISSQLVTALTGASTVQPVHSNADGVVMGVVATVDIDLLQVANEPESSVPQDGY